MEAAGRGRWSSRAAIVAAVLFAVALLFLALSFDFAPPEPVGPDVIVVLLDVLRADHLSVYGYGRETSPKIDAFAQDAVIFDQAISQSTFTKTSVASIFSARYPFRHGVYEGSLSDTESNITSDVLPESLPTLAEAFRDGGYTTAAWVQNDQLRSYMGFQQGFDLYHERVGKANDIVNAFLSWQRKKRRGSFFAYLHILDIHGPYTPPPPYDTKFGTYSDTYEVQMPRWRTYRREVARGEVVPSEADIEQLKALYDGEIAAVDAAVGRLFDELRSRGLYEDSIIVVTSDHGDGFYDHGYVGHSTTPYEELIRVPLLIKLPGNRFAGTRVADVQPLVDLAPTLLELAGAPAMADTDGVSQVSRLRGAGRAGGEDRAPADTEDRVVVSEFKECVALRDERWKYMRCGDEAPGLFDLHRDPGEKDNVLELHPEVAERLGERAEAVRTLRRAPADRVVVDAETVEALKALGYL